MSAADKISSPYLIVEGSTSHDTNNSSMQTMHGTSHDTNSQTQHGLTASSVVDKTPPVPKVGHERTLLIFHAVAGLFAFLSFALMGSVGGINVQSGNVTAEDLLAASSCQDMRAGTIEGSLNMNPFRLILVCGILVWIYALACICLGATKKVAACFLRPGMGAESAKFSAVVLCIDAIFAVLSFFAFILGACYVGAPQIFKLNGQHVFFTMETFFLTMQATGLCQAAESPLPTIRGSVAMMFFCFGSMSAACVASVQMYRKRVAEKAAGTSYVNCL